MFAAEELIRAIATAGGVLSLRGDRLQYRLPAAVAHLLIELREHKPEILNLLRNVGGRVAYFPACPRCGAYCLYQEGCGAFGCLRCGLEGITEQDARIAGFLAEARNRQEAM